LLSKFAQYPLPPKVVRRILGFVDGTEIQLTPETFTTFQLSTAIMDSADNITPQWYIEPIERHIQRLWHVADVMNRIGPNLRAWYESTEGEVAAAGLLVAELAPEPDRGNPLPNGITQLLLQIEKGVLKYSWPQLTACLGRSLDVHDTISCISRISEELSPSTTHAGVDIPLPTQAAHTDMDPSLSRRI